MLQLMFSILLLIFFIGTLLYAFYYTKKHNIVLSFALVIFSVALVNWVDWRYSALAFLMLFIPAIFRSKISYATFISHSMFGAILCSFFILNLYLEHDIRVLTSIGILSVTLICVMAILGILENDLKKYLVYSNFAQVTFVFLDLSVAKLTLKISALGVIQIFNYVFAGALLLITLGILAKENKRRQISDLQGHYYRDRGTSIFAIVAAASLAGLPGLNIFVSEWLLFKTSFGIDPIITILGVFAALLLFVMYFKIVYVLLSGEVLKEERSPKLLKAYNGALALACLLFGLLPFIQLYILGKVI